jgi:hypothetical protein
VAGANAAAKTDFADAVSADLVITETHADQILVKYW